MFVVRNPDNFQTKASIHSTEAEQKKRTTFTICEIFFHTKRCYLFLCKNIHKITTKRIKTLYKYN